MLQSTGRLTHHLLSHTRRLGSKIHWDSGLFQACLALKSWYVFRHTVVCIHFFFPSVVFILQIQPRVYAQPFETDPPASGILAFQIRTHGSSRWLEHALRSTPMLPDCTEQTTTKSQLSRCKHTHVIRGLLRWNQHTWDHLCLRRQGTYKPTNIPSLQMQMVAIPSSQMRMLALPKPANFVSSFLLFPAVSG